MRIDKLLANVGFGSRKEVKKILRAGAVKANGKIVTDGKIHVDPNHDEITVYGETVKYKEFIYLMMNKPAGVISATEDVYDQTVTDLLDIDDAIYKPFPVGRLDKDTVGLLLLTNDGQLAHQLLSPKKYVPKTYYAVVRGSVTKTDQEQFSEGVELDDGYVTKPAKLKILRSGEIQSEIELTITEGKYHQVKRMFEAVGKKVVYLKRLSMGPIQLDKDLLEGEYRELTDEEITLLKELQVAKD
jgi:16S rRNA pseudouridine516 synthase